MLKREEEGGVGTTEVEEAHIITYHLSHTIVVKGMVGVAMELYVWYFFPQTPYNFIPHHVALMFGASGPPFLADQPLTTRTLITQGEGGGEGKKLK